MEKGSRYSHHPGITRSPCPSPMRSLAMARTLMWRGSLGVWNGRISTFRLSNASYVWSIKQASRFVESLLLGLPVPGIFLAKDEGTQKLLIIDGQQRLYSLLYFYQGIWPQTGKEFILRGLEP